MFKLEINDLLSHRFANRCILHRHDFLLQIYPEHTMDDAGSSLTSTNGLPTTLMNPLDNKQTIDVEMKLSTEAVSN